MTKMKEPHDSAIDTDAADWVARLSSQDVTDTDRAAFQDWLAASSDHRRAFDEAQRTWLDLDALSSLANTEPDALPCELRLEIDRAARLAEERWHHRARRTGLRWWASVAAALVVGVLGTLWMVRLGSGPANDGSSASTFRTQVGERREILLVDGALVNLDTDTEVHVALTPGQRSVHLEHGEACVSVAKDPDRPFIVTVGGGTVRAVGTEFNVYHRGDRTTVTVLEGAVDVIPPAPESAPSGAADAVTPTERRRIRRSQTMTFGNAGAEVVDLTPEMTARATSWRSGRLYFDHATLAEMVAEIDHYLPEHVVIADDDIAGFTGGGVIHVDNVESILAAIEKAWPVRVVKESPGVIVIKRRG